MGDFFSGDAFGGGAEEYEYGGGADDATILKRRVDALWELVTRDAVLSTALGAGGIDVLSFVPADSITNVHIAPDTVTAAELAPDSVGNSELQDNAVAQPNMQDNSVGSAEIIAANVLDAHIDTVSAAKLIGNILAASMTPNVIAAINAASGQINEARVNLSVAFSELTGTIALAQIADQLITGGKLANDTVTATQLAAGSTGGASELGIATLGTIEASKPVTVDASLRVNVWTVVGLLTALANVDLGTGGGSVVHVAKNASATLAFFAGTPQGKQAIFSNVVNSSISSGYQAGNIYDFANFVSPAGGPYNFTSDAPVIFSTLYKICEWIERVNNQILRGHGLAS